MIGAAAGIVESWKRLVTNDSPLLTINTMPERQMQSALKMTSRRTSFGCFLLACIANGATQTVHWQLVEELYKFMLLYLNLHHDSPT